MVPKLSDLSTNVKDRSPDEPIARGASESSCFQDYSALLSGPQRNIQPSGGIGLHVSVSGASAVTGANAEAQ